MLVLPHRQAVRLRTSRVSLLKQYAGLVSTTATPPLLTISSYSDTAGGVRGTDRLKLCKSLVLFGGDFHAVLIIIIIKSILIHVITFTLHHDADDDHYKKSRYHSNKIHTNKNSNITCYSVEQYHCMQRVIIRCCCYL